MFYDKEIKVLTVSDGYTDDMGIYQPGEESVLKIIMADVQPYSRLLAYEDYGFNEEVTYRFFCDPDSSLEVGGKVEYNNQQFEIRKIVDWDNYFIVMIYG